VSEHGNAPDRGWARALSGAFQTLLMVLNPLRLRANITNLGLWIQINKNPDVLEVWCRYFDPAYYLRTHVDVAEKGVDPCIHFLLFGNEERRNPSVLFDLESYLLRYPDVVEAGINGLMHYARFGRAEGRIAKLEKSGGSPSDSMNAAGLVLSFETSPEAGRDSVSPERLVVNNYWLPGRPLLSVVIPCFNYGKYVGEAVRSVSAQTFFDLEVLVIDGGSTDPDSIEQLKQLESVGLPGVTVHYRNRRHMVGDNRNFGISLAKGRYICCLDADDRLSPTYIEVALFLAEGYGFDLVYSSIACFGKSDFRWLVTDPSFSEVIERNKISTAAIFRKSVWAHAGGFRDWHPGEDYVPEDWEFWARLIGHGSRAKSIREPLLQYRVHSEGITGTSNMDAERQRKAIREANLGLFDSVNKPLNSAVTVLNPWININKSGEDSRPGFLMALPFVTIGGAETLLYGLAEEIVNRGFRLVVVTSLALPATVPDKVRKFDELTPHVYPLAHLFHDENMPEDFVCGLIERYRVSHLFFAGCKLIYDLLPRLDRDFPDLAVIDQLFNDKVHAPDNRYYRKFIDATVVPSEALKSSLVGATPEDPGVISIVAHSVTIPDLRVRPIADVRAELSLPADKVIVAFFGRLSEEKGGDIFVEIARNFVTDDRLFFLMTGEGPERERIQRMIEKYRLQNQLLMAGFVQDVTPLMQAADIVVVPSLLDGMPLVVLEAQGYEKPVVASIVGSIPSMISNGETGYLCPPGDVTAFSGRIAELAANPVLRQSMGRLGRIAVRENYSREGMLNAYFETFERARAMRDTASAGTVAG
jgi:glycosyltransferase involved in cell wall biosynthesis